MRLLFLIEILTGRYLSTDPQTLRTCSQPRTSFLTLQRCSPPALNVDVARAKAAPSLLILLSYSPPIASRHHSHPALIPSRDDLFEYFSSGGVIGGIAHVRVSRGFAWPQASSLLLLATDR
jgi:hypothetical protein